VFSCIYHTVQTFLYQATNKTVGVSFPVAWREYIYVGSFNDTLSLHRLSSVKKEDNFESWTGKDVEWCGCHLF